MTRNLGKALGLAAIGIGLATRTRFGSTAKKVGTSSRDALSGALAAWPPVQLLFATDQSEPRRTGPRKYSRKRKACSFDSAVGA
jgi:hypothetical protein